MKTYSKLTLFLSLLSSLSLLVEADAWAFRGGFRGGDRGERHEDFHHNHNAAHHNNANHDHANHNHANHDNANHNDANRNDLAAAHKENAPSFSHQHLTMNPHAGIPNNGMAHNNFANHNLANNNWHNNNWNNNNWNHGWGGGWNGGWNNGLMGGAFLGAAFGATFGAALFSPYGFMQPYYYDPAFVEYPVMDNYAPAYSQAFYPANPAPIAPATKPTNETWIAEKDGTVPKNAVVNNVEQGKSTYYCRTTYLNKLSYGVLVPDDGCYIETSSMTMRFTAYETLVSN